MFSTISNINLMRKQDAVAVPQNAVWMIGESTNTGNVSVSANAGTTWNSYRTGLSSVRGIAYGLTIENTPLWVAAGVQPGGGRISVSSNSGNTWTVVTSIDMTATFYCAAYGKNSSNQNLFMVGGYSTSGNIVFSSSDGTTWTGIMPVNTIMNLVSGITYGQLSSGTKVWIAVGIFRTGGAGVAYSSDGSTWSSVSASLGFSTALLTSVSFGIDNAGNKRWVVSADMNANTSPCVFTLINPISDASFSTWSEAVSTTFMKGKSFSVAFGRGVSGNVWAITGGLGAGSGNTIVTYNGSTSVGYIPASSSQYQGSQVGYLNTGSNATSRFYATHLYNTPVPNPNQIAVSQNANSWAYINLNYIAYGNQVSGAIVSSIPY
jgi:hypothetical protein